MLNTTKKSIDSKGSKKHGVVQLRVYNLDNVSSVSVGKMVAILEGEEGKEECRDDDCQLKEESNEFLSWLQKKAGVEISSMLSIGNSVYGRSLFASKCIKSGDCILKVPYNVQMTSDKFPSDIEPFLVHDVGNVSRLAAVLLAEQKLGQNSGWATYINSLPHMDEMHNTALEHFPQTFGDVRLEDFMHAYALDFLNHDGTFDAILLSNEDKRISEVIADRNYNIGEQVMIRYGKFSNATLLLDFGFTLPYNTYDQVVSQLTC
ncbi:hypothetical protein COCNU_07G002840 [Cocos nucifera]|uniref:SET domain-containing protein n=1 Tax=Cocos nucifera TaxID=13894 RepID=A0A8K0N4E8_COCNU|nr:hypothetical protein COCNU_07G002840 [Cocos nucifera]